jgi:hypothetical protein
VTLSLAPSMLYLKNSKGDAATSLIEDIFIEDLLNRASCLQSLLSAIRSSGASTAHFIKTGHVALELLMAAEGLEVSVLTDYLDVSRTLLKQHHTDHLLREAQIECPQVLLFDSLSMAHRSLSEFTIGSASNQTKVLIVFDLDWKRNDLKLVLETVDKKHLQIKTLYFGCFSRLTKRGKLGRWLARIDQSVVKHLIPARLKQGFYLEITHV